VQGVVLGADSLLKKLGTIPVRAMKAVDASLADASQAIEQEAKDLAPVESSELRDGMKAQPVVRSDSFVAHEMVSEAPHTIHVEYGTSDQPAQPMMRPAFDQNVGRTITRTKAAVKAVLR
jgi:HK97 gp10 family phage protein